MIRKFLRRGLVIAVVAIAVFAGGVPAVADNAQPVAAVDNVQLATADDDVQPMIIGGENATKSWAVAFQSPAEPDVPAQDGLWPSCGGVLITDQWVLTAAHCGPFLTHARVGTLDWRHGGELVRVAKVITHEQYDEVASARYDIALVKLAKRVKTKPVPIFLDGGVNSLSLVQGWGTRCDKDITDHACHEDVPDLLQQLWLKQLNGSSCEFPGAPEVYHGPSMLCLVSADGKNKQVCFGDSGGPILRMIGDKPYLIGTVTGDADSYGVHPHLCSTAQNGGPGKMMATKTAFYLDWIITNLYKYDIRAGKAVEQSQYALAS